LIKGWDTPNPGKESPKKVKKKPWEDSPVEGQGGP